MPKKKKYRKNIPKAVKDRLWDITFGPAAGEGKCYTCDAVINSKRFEAGHGYFFNISQNQSPILPLLLKLE